jgi:hypothetical protein
MGVCIDHYDQRSFGVTASVYVYFLNERFPHPAFGVSLARGGTLNSHFTFSHPALFEVSAGEHFMTGIFQNHDEINPR